MQKSNKISVFYILSSIGLFLTLLFGGIYGVYTSIGLNFMRSNMSGITNAAGSASNVSYGGTINFQRSTTGIIILSIALIVLAIIDVISLIKQVVLFKQYKIVSQSSITKKIEKKVKSKGAVIFFAVIVDLLSIAAGITGIFLNNRTYLATNVSWVMYLIDAIISLLALLSIILLIVKLKKLKSSPSKKSNSSSGSRLSSENNLCYTSGIDDELNINLIEYNLLKLKQLKSANIISQEEYNNLRQKVLPVENKRKRNRLQQNLK